MSRKSSLICRTRTPAPKYGGENVMTQRINRALPNFAVSHLSIRTRTQTHGLAGEPALGRRQQVKAEQADVAAQGDQRLGAAEQPGDLIGEADGEVLIHTLAFAIGLQRRKVARRSLAGQQRVGQGDRKSTRLNS